MNMRRITSLTSFLSFIVVMATSLILYIVPQGRVAYWSDWRLWGLSKEEWGAIHINLGFLFLISLLIHIYYNWKPVLLYLKNRAKRLILFTPDFNAALGLTLIFIFGTLTGLPPFSSIIGLSESFKEAAAVRYGEPPYGHAELSSLKVFSKKVGLEPESALSALKRAGIKVDNDSETLKEIAKKNTTSPQKLYKTILSNRKNRTLISSEKRTLPESPGPGTGNMTIAGICSSYNLNIKTVIRSLKSSGLKVEAKLTLKEAGKQNRKNPVDIYEMIRESAEDRK